MATPKKAPARQPAAAVPKKKAVPSGWKAVRDLGLTVKQRSAALMAMISSIGEAKEATEGILKLLVDQTAPIALRLAVLQALQAASFASAKFNAMKPKFLATLRAASEDPDPELRQRVLGILARESDGKTQLRLLRGLKEPETALVPPEKALQLLSYDAHAEAYEAARAIVARPPNDAARQEALRLLAADAGSAKLFSKLLSDKKEAPSIRRLSARVLHSLAPRELQKKAREIVLDHTDDESVRASSLTALTHFGDEDALAKDNAVQQQAAQLQKSAATSPDLKQGAAQFLSRYV